MMTEVAPMIEPAQSYTHAQVWVMYNCERRKLGEIKAIIEGKENPTEEEAKILEVIGEC